MQTQPCKKGTSKIDEYVGLERLVFFSDAVFAIAITLLALDIHLPMEATNLSNQQLLISLLHIWPKYLSFIISFLVIGNLTGLLSAILWWYASRENRLINKSFDKRLARQNLFSILTVPIVFLFSIGLTLINPTLGKLSWILTVPAALMFRINRSQMK